MANLTFISNCQTKPLKFNVHIVHIRRIRRKNQQHALIVPSFIYFYVLVPPELLENTTEGW
jgi:hypothetical protein